MGRYSPWFDEEWPDYFSMKEFNRVEVAGKKYNVRFSEVGLYLLDHLVLKVLSPIRNYFGKPMRITCGARSMEAHQAILAAHKKDPSRPKPSRTSDHFFSNAVYPQGVGAADVAIHGVSPQDILIFAMQKELPTGQVIAYPARHFAHLSNPKSVLFSEAAIKVTGEKKPYLIWTTEGGYRPT